MKFQSCTTAKKNQEEMAAWATQIYMQNIIPSSPIYPNAIGTQIPSMSPQIASISPQIA